MGRGRGGAAWKNKSKWRCFSAGGGLEVEKLKEED
jgi:hypothetical protein